LELKKIAKVNLSPRENGSESIVEKKKEVWWCGPANDAGGYGKMNLKCIEGLYSKGFKIQLDLFKIPDLRSSVPLSKSLSEMIQNEVSEDSQSVWAIMPPKFLPRKGKKIVFTMLESSEVHPSFVQKLNYANEIWLPCDFNIEALSRAKVGPEIFKMPLGVDTDLYCPMDLTDEQKDIFKIRTKSFVFVSLFGWSLRKGYDVLLKSYLKTFTKDDDVSLVIASRKFGSTNKEMVQSIREEIKQYIENYCPQPENAPHIVHIGQCMKEEEIPILMNMSDCFVLPSRGEGFGLPYLEAGACSIPVIGTRCCGQMEFLNDNNSYLIDIDGYGANKGIAEISSYYGDVPFAVLGDRQVKLLSETMSHVVDNYSEAREKAKILRKDILDNFTWNHLVDKIAKRLGG